MILSAAPSRLPTFNSCPPGQAGLRLTDLPVKNSLLTQRPIRETLLRMFRAAAANPQKPFPVLTLNYFMLHDPRRKLFLAICCIVPALFAEAQTFADTALAIEKTFARYKPANPGAQVSVSRNGVIIYSHSWGMADMEHNIPLTTENVSEAGSVTKEFTAAAILLLEQQGLLSLNDDIRKYLPEIPSYGSVIRIRHLMHHTSGIKDWGYVADIGGWARTTRTYRNEDALEIIARQKTLNNKPGDEYVYSNSGYNLLAIIAERASGMSLPDFTKKYIFIPAGMTHTQWRDNFKRIVPGRAIAYAKTPGGYETDMPNEYVYGNGALLTTTEDLCRWVDFYSSARLGGPALLKKQVAPDTFNNGNLHYYAAGLRISKKKGYNMISHNGATASYRASLEFFPDLGLSIAGLSNTSEFDTSSYDVFNKIEDVFLPKKPAPEKPVPPVISAERLQAYTGRYRNTKSGEALQVDLSEGKLFADKRPLRAVSENSFRFGTELLVFVGKKVLDVNDEKDTTIWLTVAAPETKRQIDYTGNYYSAETLSPLSISFRNDSLILSLHPYQTYHLLPVYKDGFEVEGFGAVLYFDRDRKNNITGLKISNARARNVGFEKMEKGK